VGDAILDFRNVTKRFGRGSNEVPIVDDLTLRVPRGRAIGLLGRNGAGKSTLLRLIAGTLPPDRGQVERRGRISWPVGFAGSFHPDLTGRENLRFVARLYGAETRMVEAFVGEFSGLDTGLDAPFRTYSAGMRARLAFGLSMAMPFDLYLIDEITAVGDAAFRESSEALLRARLAEAGGVVVSHSLRQVKALCTSAMVLDGGQLTWHEMVDDGIAHHRKIMGVAA
jgi:capsular polysaccharide transport system ATP-binding protein